MKSDGNTSLRSAIPAANERGRRVSSMSGELALVRFARGGAEVREFDVETTRMESIRVQTSREDTGARDDSPRVYKLAFRERIRKARRQTVPVNEARALWRAERLRSKLETCDEKHFGVPLKLLAALRRFVAETRVASGTHDKETPHSEVDLSFVNDEAFVIDVGEGWVHAFESGAGGPTSEDKKKSKIGVAWRSLSTSCTRAAQFTSKSLSIVRRKTWFQNATSEDASHGGAQKLRFARWPKRDTSRVHPSLAPVVPHQDA
eukprot:TRINITY_DN6529_c0_g1_i1.p1 TRINITY_DN6529_c0_g1~~TRINITY_DN6529_c0_g1_i1.p1  ORF type:complete len:262 (-),score=39.53 TRINITY_DN6529_c0_g1_i1:85-870(-)